MKQSKTEKAVFAKLSTQKVELGLAQDLLQMYNSLSNSFTNMSSEIARAKKIAANANVDVKVFYKKAQDVEAMAKELGVSPKDIDLSKFLRDIKQFQKSFDSVIKL